MRALKHWDSGARGFSIVRVAVFEQVVHLLFKATKPSPSVSCWSYHPSWGILSDKIRQAHLAKERTPLISMFSYLREIKNMAIESPPFMDECLIRPPCSSGSSHCHVWWVPCFQGSRVPCWILYLWSPKEQRCKASKKLTRKGLHIFSSNRDDGEVTQACPGGNQTFGKGKSQSSRL